MRIIKASTGTTEQFMDAVKSKIEELGGSVKASSNIEAASDFEQSGSTEDFMSAVQAKIKALGGIAASKKAEIEECDSASVSTTIQASASIDEIVDFLASKGYDGSSKEVRSYAGSVKSYLDMCEKAWDDYGEPSKYTLEQWYADTQMNYPYEFEDLPKVDPSSVTVDEVLEFLSEKGLDETSEAVKNYAEAAASYIDMYRKYGEPYTVEQWYKDTMSNYPDDIISLREGEPIEFSEAIMGDADTEIDRDKLWEIADRYTTSSPLSGDWDTETLHEQQAISEELGVSMKESKRLMIEELGFSEEDFEIEAAVGIPAESFDEITYDSIEATEDDDAESVQEIDDDTETITASQYDDDEYDTNLDADTYEYLNDLEVACEKELEADTINWDDDDDTLYLTITIGDSITDYDIPIEDLSRDLETDVKYILDAVNSEEE